MNGADQTAPAAEWTGYQDDVHNLTSGGASGLPAAASVTSQTPSFSPTNGSNQGTGGGGAGQRGMRDTGGMPGMGEGPWEEGPFGSNQGTRVVVADGGGVQSAGGGGQDGNTFSPEICEGNNGANVAAWSSPEDPSIAASPPPPSHDPSAQQQQYAYQGNPSASFAASASPPER